MGIFNLFYEISWGYLRFCVFRYIDVFKCYFWVVVWIFLIWSIYLFIYFLYMVLLFLSFISISLYKEGYVILFCFIFYIYNFICLLVIYLVSIYVILVLCFFLDVFWEFFIFFISMGNYFNGFWMFNFMIFWCVL